MATWMKCGLWVAAMALAGCASSGTGSATGGTTAATHPENHGGEGHGEHHHHALPPTLTAFHEVLRPLWHSDAGAERDTRSCAQAATLRARAQAVIDGPVPESAQSQQQAWATAAAQLAATSDALVTACGATPRGNVAGGLEAVHTAFHGLMDRLGQH